MIGDEVADFKAAAEWFSSGNKLIDDYAEFYRERAAIEREAAQKLEALVQRQFSKKGQVSAVVSVGPTPATTPGSLENSSLGVWTTVLQETETSCKERRRLAEFFTTSIGNELQMLNNKWNGILAKASDVYDQLRGDVSTAKSQVNKLKSSYDDACQAMEHARSKNRKVEQKETEMSNAKNAYLIGIARSNRLQDKHFGDDVPELLDVVESAYVARTYQFNRIFKLAVAGEKQYCESIVALLGRETDAIAANNPRLDVQMFVRHNSRPIHPPTPFSFTPSPVWHDEPDMDVSETGLKFLRARLAHADASVGPATDTSKAAVDEFQDAKGTLVAADNDRLIVSQAATMVQRTLATLKRLAESETTRVGYEAELEAIEDATADKDMSSVPLTRTKKKRTVFGKKKEIVEVVQDSGSVHQSGGLGIKSLLARAKAATSDAPTARVLYDFEGQAEGELSVSAGETLVLLERDSGSGWIKVRRGGEEGLVPATYCDVKAPAPPPSRASKGPEMVALYDYDAGDDSQLSIKANDRIAVVEADPGNGWTTGTLNGRTGIFPTSYARSA